MSRRSCSCSTRESRYAIHAGRSRRRRPRRPTWWARPTLLIALTLLTACSSPSFVEQIEFVNQGDFPAEIQISNADGSGWLPIGLVQGDAEKTFRQVIDQGDTWIFRFDYLEEHIEEVQMSRSELVDSDWTVEVPDEFERSLHEMGFSPPP